MGKYLSHEFDKLKEIVISDWWESINPPGKKWNIEKVLKSEN